MGSLHEEGDTDVVMIVARMGSRCQQATTREAAKGNVVRLLIEWGTGGDR
jgi:hypothetical protein